MWRSTYVSRLVPQPQLNSIGQSRYQLTCQLMTPPSARKTTECAFVSMVPELPKNGKDKKVKRTPPLALRLADAAGECRGRDVSRDRVGGGRGLAEDDLAARDPRRDDLEQRGLGPRRGRGRQQPRARRVLRGALCYGKPSVSGSGPTNLGRRCSHGCRTGCCTASEMVSEASPEEWNVYNGRERVPSRSSFRPPCSP